MQQEPGGFHELERDLEAVRFQPRESLGPEVMGRVRRGERSLSGARSRRVLPWSLAAAALLATGLVYRDATRAPDLAVVDTCCSNLDGGDRSDDGARVFVDSRGVIQRVEVYEDLDESGDYTPGDLVRLVRGPSPVLLEDRDGPVLTTRHCCVDLDREGPGDDGLLVLSRPGEEVVLAAIYETGSSRPLR